MFDLDNYLETQRHAVDSVLDREIPTADVKPTVLHSAMRHAVFSGGKRIRPILCLAAGEAAGVPATQAQRAAAAVEVLHTYTLVHDDLPCMDDDSERRGQPTVHVVFGEANAVLAGDALQALAFELAARTDPPPPYRGADLVAELARASGSLGVVGGQVEDLAAEPATTDAALVEYIHMNKTAALFRAAVRMGAMTGGVSDSLLSALTRYAEHVGLAFQIADDLLDTGDRGLHGDTELSCLSVWSADEAAQRAQQHVTEAVDALSTVDDERAQPLAAIARYTISRTH